MQDLKRQSNRRPAVRKLRTSSMSVRKNRSNPIPGLTVKLRKPSIEPGYSNSWIPPYFVKNEPSFLREKTRWLIQQFIRISGLAFILWLAGGSVWIGQTFFQQMLTKVHIKGNLMLNDTDVLRTSGLRPGQLVFNLKPYQIAARLQSHPIVRKADIRRKFPDEISLIINEYQPIAMLKTSHQVNNLSLSSSAKTNYILIGNDQRLLKQLSVDEMRNSQHKNLPLINGFRFSSMRLGTRLHSPVLKRGLRFLATFQDMVATQQLTESKTHMKFENQFRTTDWASQPIQIDISDPLNLIINWPLNFSELLPPISVEPLRTVPLTIQMGSRDFGERLRTFQNIYPVLGKQHPRLKSIDLRYKNRVMLIP